MVCPWACSSCQPNGRGWLGCSVVLWLHCRARARRTRTVNGIPVKAWGRRDLARLFIETVVLGGESKGEFGAIRTSDLVKGFGEEKLLLGVQATKYCLMNTL